ncbi:MAG: hypothetical protein ACKN9R_00095 [Candidatus Limnocylindrus sp.]
MNPQFGRRHLLYSSLLVTTLVCSLAAPRVLATTLGAPDSSDASQLPTDTAAGDEVTDPAQSDESMDGGDEAPSTDAPEESLAPEPGGDPGDSSDGEGSGDAAVDDSGDGGGIVSGPIDTPPPPPTPRPISLHDILSATSQGSPLDADLALKLLKYDAPTSARNIEVSDSYMMREVRVYDLRDVHRWSYMPRLGIQSSTVWMRFSSGDRTPFAVSTGRDTTAPRISSTRAQRGYAHGSTPPPYTLYLRASDSETGINHIEIRVGFGRPVVFPFEERFAFGPLFQAPGGKPVWLASGSSIDLRVVDAAGRASSWRRIRLP